MSAKSPGADSGAASDLDQAALAKAALAAAGAGAVGRAGGGGAGGSGSGSGFSDLFGQSGAGGAGGGDPSRQDRFSAGMDDVNPVGSEDPGDYFTRLGMSDSLFKIVERRYRNKAVVWSRNAADLISSKSRVP